MNIRLSALLWLLAVVLVGCRVEKYPPELSKLLPDKAPIGQEVSIIGYQFGDAPAVSLGKEGTFYQAKVLSSTDQSVKIVIPRMPIGSTEVRVTNEQGTTDPLPFTVIQPLPIISSITPTNALPGQTIVIAGDFLDQLQWVRFGPVGVSSFEGVSPQSVTVIMPTSVSRGPLTLEVETVGGKITRPFLAAGTPEIAAFAPKRPRLSEEVTVTGKNLFDGVVRVGALVMPITKNTDTELRFSVPANAVSGRVSVTLYDQLTATTTDSLILALPPVLDVNGFSITEGVKGDRLIVTGRNLRDISAVTVGGTTATFRALSDTQLEITLPDRPQVGDVFVTLTNPGGTVTGSQPLLYYNAPSNLTFGPLRTLRGREVVVNGQSMFRITGVTVNGRPAAITSRIEGSEIKFNVPADATTGPIFVINRAGSATTTRSLTVVLPPTITDFTRKAIVGNRVTLTGTFLLDANVYFTGSANPAPNDGRNTDGELWVRIPNDAQTGPIRVVNLAGETTTTASFTALRAPVGIAFGPDLARAGTDITVTGQNLTDVSVVKFGNGQSSPAKFRVSGQSLIVTVPTDATNGPICLTNEAGTVCSAGSFTVLAPASIITFTPLSASIGSTITITGTNVINTREVRFNNGRSAPATFRVSGQSLIVTVPADVQQGAICLTNDGGIGCSGLDFRPLVPPANLALSASSGAVGTEITITGANLASVREVRFSNGKSSAARIRGTGTNPVGLIVTVPADAVNGPVCVTNDGGTTCTVASFTVR